MNKLLKNNIESCIAVIVLCPCVLYAAYHLELYYNNFERSFQNIIDTIEIIFIVFTLFYLFSKVKNWLTNNSVVFYASRWHCIIDSLSLIPFSIAFFIMLSNNIEYKSEAELAFKIGIALFFVSCLYSIKVNQNSGTLQILIILILKFFFNLLFVCTGLILFVLFMQVLHPTSTTNTNKVSKGNYSRHTRRTNAAALFFVVSAVLLYFKNIIDFLSCKNNADRDISLNPKVLFQIIFLLFNSLAISTMLYYSFEKGCLRYSTVLLIVSLTYIAERLKIGKKI